MILLQIFRVVCCFFTLNFLLNGAMENFSKKRWIVLNLLKNIGNNLIYLRTNSKFKNTWVVFSELYLSRPV